MCRDGKEHQHLPPGSCRESLSEFAPDWLEITIKQGQVGLQELLEISERVKEYDPNNVYLGQIVDNFCFDQVCSPYQQNPQYQYQACVWSHAPQPQAPVLSNSDCPEGPDRCGVLVLKIAENQENWKNANAFSGRRESHEGTSPVLNFERVISIEVEGPGCYVLYENPNYEKPPMIKVYAGLRLSTTIPAIQSIEYWYDCKGTFEDNSRILGLQQRSASIVTNFTGNQTLSRSETNISKFIFGGGSGLAAILMILVLVPTFKESHKSKQQTENETQEMSEITVQSEVQKKQEMRKLGVNFSALWDEAVCWRTHFSWPNALTTILLGVVLSAWDVSSDYSYAQTWEGDGYDSQIRALVYFLICLPHLMTILKAVNFCITAVFNFPSLRRSLRLLGRSVGIVLYLAFLAATTYGAGQLGRHHPDAFAYLAIPSAALTICIKIAGVIVQGPEAKRALTLLTARYSIYLVLASLKS